jgi:hypothetical protein
MAGADARDVVGQLVQHGIPEFIPAAEPEQPFGDPDDSLASLDHRPAQRPAAASG